MVAWADKRGPGGTDNLKISKAFMSQSQSDHTPRLDALTSLRFFTALWVFLFHIHIRWPLKLGPIVDSFIRVGAFGMSFFFILSGFILAYRYKADIVSDRLDYARYVITRFGRIYPNYLFVLLITAPLINWDTAPVRGALGDDMGQSLLFLMSASALLFAALTLIQGFFYTHFGFWANGGAWSLSVEFFCYLLLPVIVSSCAALTQAQCRAGFYALAVLSSVIGATAVLSQAESASVYAHPAIRALEFVMGVIAFKLFHEYNWTIERPLRIVAGLVCYSVVAGFFPGNYILHNFVVAPLIGFIIVAAVTNRGFQNALSHRVLIYLGETSYAFYMFQLFVLLLFDRFVPKDANGLLVLGVGLIATQVGASLMFHALETPAKKLITDWERGPFSSFVKPRY